MGGNGNARDLHRQSQITFSRASLYTLSFLLSFVSFSDITNPSHHNWDVFQLNAVSNKTNLLHGQLSLSAVVLNAGS